MTSWSKERDFSVISNENPYHLQSSSSIDNRIFKCMPIIISTQRHLHTFSCYCYFSNHSLIHTFATCPSHNITSYFIDTPEADLPSRAICYFRLLAYYSFHFCCSFYVQPSFHWLLFMVYLLEMFRCFIILHFYQKFMFI